MTKWSFDENIDKDYQEMIENRQYRDNYVVYQNSAESIIVEFYSHWRQEEYKIITVYKLRDRYYASSWATTKDPEVARVEYDDRVDMLRDYTKRNTTLGNYEMDMEHAYKPGDHVRVTNNPVRIDEHPVWMSEMDESKGEVYPIKSTGSCLTYRLEGVPVYGFAERWLEPVSKPKEPDESFSEDHYIGKTLREIIQHWRNPK